MALLAIAWRPIVAEEDASGRTITLEIITKNFDQNMDLLKKEIREQNVQDLIDVVRKQARSLSQSYLIHGGGNRDRLMQEKRDLRLKTHFIKADQDRLIEIDKEINAMDPNGMLSNESAALNSSISDLQDAVNALAPITPEDKDVNRLILQHLEFYSAAMTLAGLNDVKSGSTSKKGKK